MARETTERDAVSRSCAIVGCGRLALARGWCVKHYRRWQSTGDPLTTRVGVGHEPAIVRFVSYVDFVNGDGCWLWTGGRYKAGYGRFRASADEPSVYAHRWLYDVVVGPVPLGMELDHLCRVRACVCPDHLEPVTRRENILRGESPSASHARQTHCLRGHAFDERNTYVMASGRRQCRACRSERGASRRVVLRGQG